MNSVAHRCIIILHQHRHHRQQHHRRHDQQLNLRLRLRDSGRLNRGEEACQESCQESPERLLCQVFFVGQSASAEGLQFGELVWPGR